MAFSSIPFLCAFLPVVFLIYCMLPSMKVRNFLLILVSLMFYAYGEGIYVCLMIGCAFLNYLFALANERCGAKMGKFLLVFVVMLNLGMLGMYKYAGMAVETLNRIAGLDWPVPSVRLPIGISFFTFQALSYTVDVYRGKNKAERHFSRILLYISFFPQLIAGPIVKYNDIAKQLEERQVTLTGCASGLRRFIVGLSKKVLLSNTMGAAADYVYALPFGELSAPSAWIGAAAYMLQIYFDFSGYSDMAIGLGRMFGFCFLENFRYPYIAGSIQDFWRRWHISLTDWFREYLYIPLGGNRKGKTRTWLNRLIVFFATGLWHGANWTFVLWGLFQGAFLTFETVCPKIVKKLGWLRHFYVLLVVCVGFVLFRADNVMQAGVMLRTMFTGFHQTREMAAATAAICDRLFVVTFFAAAICAMPLKEWVCKIQQKWKCGAVLGGMSYVGSLFLLLACMMSLAGGTYNPFIYFRF